METNWAAEHLQTIRTLMERSALYRRALAPIMTFTGVLGTAGAVVAIVSHVETSQAFVLFWATVGLLSLAGSFLLVRRQALKESEAFWSPPTRRVAQAMIPPFLVGAVAGLPAALGLRWELVPLWGLPMLWMLLYGCALSAAGFFMVRAVKYLGWVFLVCGCAMLAAPAVFSGPPSLARCNEIMGGVFGGLHLLGGIYLYFTEKGKNAA